MKNYPAQTPQNLALTKNLQKISKTSTPLESLDVIIHVFANQTVFIFSFTNRLSNGILI